MKYFTIAELCYSDTARRRGIDNTPDEDIKAHIVELIEGLLDPLRTAWGSPIRVTSGYRSKALNTAIRGSKTSAHLTGWAADLQPVNGRMDEFKAFTKEFLRHRRFDQWIDEASGSSEWVHIGIRNQAGLQRGQYLTYRNGVYTRV